MENIIQAYSLCKTYGGRKVIDNMSFCVPRGSFTACVGPSGAGKSTILNMIGLLESIDSGYIEYDGVKMPSINSVKATKMRRNNINYLFQSFALIADSSVEDNLLYAMQYVKKSKKEKRKEIAEALESLGVAHVQKNNVNTLSGGESQRVALARCIVKPGDLVLADEPTGSLDEQNSENVFELLSRLRDERGKTIVMVTHDMSLANKCDDIISLHK
ncbi:MAG: ATP-binding cassette domain-containing protein [Actinomycetaceae bacterium]|nr:ATP-binding cassette domain-containing protein [Actinomycetaceae bacterium]